MGNEEADSLRTVLSSRMVLWSQTLSLLKAGEGSGISSAEASIKIEDTRPVVGHSLLKSRAGGVVSGGASKGRNRGEVRSYPELRGHLGSLAGRFPLPLTEAPSVDGCLAPPKPSQCSSRVLLMGRAWLAVRDPVTLGPAFLCFTFLPVPSSASSPRDGC